MPPTMWRWMGCAHTHLLPVAVRSEGPVGSPSQRCPVVVEVASRVHLVLHAQKNHTLVRKQPVPSKDNFMLSCSKLRTEQSLHLQNVRLQNPRARKTPSTKDTTAHGCSPLAFLLTAYWAFMCRINTAHSMCAKSWKPQYKIQSWIFTQPPRHRLGALHSASCPWLNKTCISGSPVVCIQVHTSAFFKFVLWIPSTYHQLYTLLTTPKIFQLRIRPSAC